MECSYTAHREKLRAENTILKEKRDSNKQCNLPLLDTRKKKTKPKASGRQEIKIRAEKNELNNRKVIEKMSEIKN